MAKTTGRTCTAFEGFRKIASGDFAKVALKTKAVVDRGELAPVLVFDDMTSELVEFDLRGTNEEVLARITQASTPADKSSESEQETPVPRGAGRPRLGVVGREVTLLPRHWEWLNQQPGGASVALRKLVEEAKRANEVQDRARLANEWAYRFMHAIGGNLRDFEEATRALFASNYDRFEKIVADWPKDVRAHVSRLIENCRAAAATTTTQTAALSARA